MSAVTSAFKGKADVRGPLRPGPPARSLGEHLPVVEQQGGHIGALFTVSPLIDTHGSFERTKISYAGGTMLGSSSDPVLMTM
jgi:hypothetical protein